MTYSWRVNKPNLPLTIYSIYLAKFTWGANLDFRWVFFLSQETTSVRRKLEEKETYLCAQGNRRDTTMTRTAVAPCSRGSLEGSSTVGLGLVEGLLVVLPVEGGFSAQLDTKIEMSLSRSDERQIERGVGGREMLCTPHCLTTDSTHSRFSAASPRGGGWYCVGPRRWEKAGPGMVWFLRRRASTIWRRSSYGDGPPPPLPGLCRTPLSWSRD